MKKGLLGKWLIIILPLIAAGILLFPTFRASQLDKQRQELVNAKNETALAAFDKENGETLRKAKDSRLKLGLDLQGGIYVTLEVDVVRLLEESAMREAVDDIFLEVIEKTRQQVDASGDDDVLGAFLKNFDAIARPKGRKLFSYYDTGDNRDLSEDAIVKRLERNINEAIDQAMEVVRQRIDKYGVAETTIQKQGTRRIVLELPGVNNEAEVRSLLQTTARLEFKLVRNNVQIVRAFYAIDQLLKNKGVAPTASTTGTVASSGATAPATSTATVASNSKDTTKKDPYAGLTDEQKRAKFKKDYPFTSLFATFFNPPEGAQNRQPVPVIYEKNEFPEGDYTFQIADEQVAEFEQIMARNDVRRIVGNEYQALLSAKPEPFYEKQGVKIYYIYGVLAKAELTGDVISDAQATFDPTNNTPMVMMDMNADGAATWARVTGANVKKRIAVVLDDRVYSAPTVQNKITGGRSQITGSANIEEARLLEIILKAGALKAPVKIVEERVVGPSLGEDSIRKGILSSVISALLVVLFMIIYYATAGILADIAVTVNIIIIIAVLAAFAGTLTLPGIAGLILTFAMAVDTNILVFERIREELRRGRSLRAAVDEGFKRAFNAILDSNITTMITGAILFYLGTGPIRGFAVTLMIGIIVTLFTGITLSKVFFELILSRGATHFNLGQPAEDKATA
ncbi:MAG: protein translocase subunit SecD [Candidatus Kapaibacterium sp.]|nr:MAG: protein translocase subunit SecD [Candidatus Kapabacteria bacterium]